MNTQAELKYFAYRHVYAKRDRLTPSAVREQKKETWGAWFAEKYGEPIESYHRRVHKREQELKQGSLL